MPQVETASPFVEKEETPQKVMAAWSISENTIVLIRTGLKKGSEKHAAQGDDLWGFFVVTLVSSNLTVTENGHRLSCLLLTDGPVLFDSALVFFEAFYNFGLHKFCVI